MFCEPRSHKTHSRTKGKHLTRDFSSARLKGFIKLSWGTSKLIRVGGTNKYSTSKSFKTSVYHGCKFSIPISEGSTHKFSVQLNRARKRKSGKRRIKKGVINFDILCYNWNQSAGLRHAVLTAPCFPFCAGDSWAISWGTLTFLSPGKWSRMDVIVFISHTVNSRPVILGFSPVMSRGSTLSSCLWHLWRLKRRSVSA